MGQEQQKYVVPTLSQSMWLRPPEVPASVEVACQVPFHRRLMFECLQMRDDVHCFGEAWREAYKALLLLSERPVSERKGNPLLMQALRGLQTLDGRWLSATADQLAGELELLYLGLVALHVEEGRLSRDFVLQYYPAAADVYWNEARKLAA